MAMNQESRLVIVIDAKNAERTAKALNSELQGITNNGNKAVSQTNAHIVTGKQIGRAHV